MSIPKASTINNILAIHKSRGTQPQCSVFRLLPNRLVMDIIKVELDRQKVERDTLDYWMELVPQTTYDRFGAKGQKWVKLRGRKRNINHQIEQLGKLNTSVKAQGYYVRKQPTEPLPAWCPANFEAPKSVRVRIADCTLAQQLATKKTDINHSCSIIRHFRARYQTHCAYSRSEAVIQRIGCKVASIWAFSGDAHLVRIAKISIRTRLQTYPER